MNTKQNEAVADLAEHECWDLLREETVGRVAIVVDGHPEIFPINFVVDHGTIVFRSAAGTKLSELTKHPSAAFEIDGHGKESIAWSVVVHGHLEPLVSVEASTTGVLALFPLQAGPKPRFARIVPSAVTGRRFGTVEPQTWREDPELGTAQPWE